MTPIIGNDLEMALWTMERIGRPIEPPFTAIGFASGQQLVAAAVFNDYLPGGNIELTLASDRPFTRTLIKTIARYAFGQLSCSRVTVRTPHEKVAKLARKFGFTREATLRDYYGRGKHAEIFRLLPHDCKRWLN